MEEKSESFGFDYVDSDLVSSTFSGSEKSSMLMQWGLDGGNLTAHRFRFHGTFNEAAEEYEALIKELLVNPKCMSTIGVGGTPTVPITVEMAELMTSEMNMDFFDRLKGTSILADTGHIRGTFNEEYDGIQVDDMLRDMFVNPDSDNVDMYSDEEKSQLLYTLLKLFVVGGCMCQPETDIARYLEATRDLYKALLTVFKRDSDGALTVAGRCYNVTALDGASLHATDDARNSMIIIVDPKKNTCIVLKSTHKSFW